MVIGFDGNFCAATGCAHAANRPRPRSQRNGPIVVPPRAAAPLERAATLVHVPNTSACPGKVDAGFLKRTYATQRIQSASRSTRRGRALDHGGPGKNRERQRQSARATPSVMHLRLLVVGPRQHQADQLGWRLVLV